MKKEEIKRKIIHAKNTREANRIIREVSEYAKNPNSREEFTLGQRAADKLTEFAGSWTFIFSLLIFVAIWMSLNILMFIYRWDPYPFILLNFILSCLAALQAPVILMSQNRSNQRDRIRAMYDYEINKKAENEIENIQKDLEEIKKLIKRKRR